MQITKDRPPGWNFYVDRGGTFTDIVAISPEGELQSLKLLSQDPTHYEDAALAGIERILAASETDQDHIESVRLGTTIGTNALLERQGANTVLVITEGFADLLEIGTQQRPDIFALDIERDSMLYTDVIEASERISADGEVLTPLDRAALLEDLKRSRQTGAESVAIALLNAYLDPQHELAAAELARQAGFSHISVSSSINPSIKLVDRGDTAVADAYLTPVLDSYKSTLLEGLEQRLDSGQLLFMQSHGGLIEAERFRGCDSVLSGPAGGVVGMAVSSVAAGFDSVIGFDMGGTSTDVSVFPGSYERSTGSTVAGCRFARPMLTINTVAAGGGSKLRFSGGRLQVGPESAGAQPGPACYRNGGPLTLTDANVLLGRIQADHFPRVFGPAAEEPIDPDAVSRGFDQLSREVAAADGGELSAPELAEGFLKIAVANMARAIEQISVQRGHDVTRFALACFGGAGGQHACAVADALGIETVLVDPLSGLLSAYGIGVAEERGIRAAGIHSIFNDDCLATMQAERQRLIAELGREFGSAARFECRAELRSEGSDTLLKLALAENSTLKELSNEFSAIHRRRFGFANADARLIVQAIEVEAIVAGAARRQPASVPDRSGANPVTERQIRFDGAWVATPIWRREDLEPDTSIAGPAMIVETNATIIVEPDWTASVSGDGMLIMRRLNPRSEQEQVAALADPIMLEIFNNQFMHIAEQMGVVLEQTAHSVNIKERLDYSCALFDRGGELIANAPHVPVHLGSMGASVREVIDRAEDLRPGDACVLNAPYRGGTHLPDITVVSPVFEAGSSQPGFYVASRAHHADVGGITPGSMPASSSDIDQEGIVIECTRIVRDGRLLESTVTGLLSGGDYPARNPAQNIADLKAQLAANSRGREQIERLLNRYGSRVVHAYMGHVRDNAEFCTREALRTLEGGSFSAQLDSGDEISVEIRIDKNSGSASIDFDGTSPMSKGNLNAPRSVVSAVVLYVLRTLVRSSIPLNAGCLVPIDLKIPPHSLLDPVPPAAVAGGNVETSQIIADVLLAAVGAQAASQGTMNNLSFGDSTHQYYETICGGCGAGPGFDGASAVHSHMTNSRLTDVEVLEQRFPVRLARFGIRHGSGGNGRWSGGDGAIREIEFLAPMHLSLLAGRRRLAPFGLGGGADGAPGRDTIIRRDGSEELLPPAAETLVEPGDRIVIETPGGGGYGKA